MNLNIKYNTKLIINVIYIFNVGLDDIINVRLNFINK